MRLCIAQQGLEDSQGEEDHVDGEMLGALPYNLYIIPYKLENFSHMESIADLFQHI